MSDEDPTSTDAPEPVDPTAAGASGAGGEEPGADPAETPWFKNPVVLAVVGIAILALAAFAIWGGSDDEDDGANVSVTDSLTIDELKELCVAQEGSASDEACAELITRLSDQEKQDITNGCVAGDPRACRLLELIGEPVPTPSTTAPPTTEPDDTVIVIPPPDPGEPTPPDPTIPDLPDPTLGELVEACLAEDGETSEAACEYLADNLTDSQKDAVRALCDAGEDDACRLLELIGEEGDAESAPTETTEA